MDGLKHNLSQKNLCRNSWIMAVELGANGNYSTAAMQLAQIYRNPCHAAAWRSLAYSTYASHLRQQGWHRQAFIYDNHALHLSADSSHTKFVSRLNLPVMSLLDALTGLAADSLGMARYSYAREYLAKAELLLEQLGGEVTSVDYIFTRHRLLLRWLWVQTELLLYTDDSAQKKWAQQALNHLDSAREIPPRYRLKTWLIAHAAQIDIANFSMEGMVDELREYNLLPLLWALYLMNNHPEDAKQIRSQFHCENWLRKDLIAV